MSIDITTMGYSGTRLTRSARPSAALGITHGDAGGATLAQRQAAHALPNLKTKTID